MPPVDQGRGRKKQPVGRRVRTSGLARPTGCLRNTWGSVLTNRPAALFHHSAAWRPATSPANQASSPCRTRTVETHASIPCVDAACRYGMVSWEQGRGRRHGASRPRDRRAGTLCSTEAVTIAINRRSATAASRAQWRFFSRQVGRARLAGWPLRRSPAAQHCVCNHGMAMPGWPASPPGLSGRGTRASAWPSSGVDCGRAASPPRRLARLARPGTPRVHVCSPPLAR